MNSAQVSTVVQCKNILGESCFWDPRDKCIWWTDIEGKKILKLDDKNQCFERPFDFDNSKHLTSFQFAKIIESFEKTGSILYKVGFRKSRVFVLLETEK